MSDLELAPAPVVSPAAPAVGGPAPVGATTEATRQQVRRLAQEFEAVLMTQMLRDMRRSMVDDEPTTAGFGTMTDVVDVELGRALSAAGGFGLSGSLAKALEKLGGPMGTSSPALPDAPGTSDWPSVSDPALPVPIPSAVPDADVTESSVLDGPVTSPFGWRRDPLNGHPGFHKGIDIAMAYGQDVRAAVGGTVVFSGENGTYGNMVAVRNPEGLETRYAHLSEPSVRVGDVVDVGGVLGRSGSSGRSTGPHLHYEVLFNGRPVDPSTVDGR